MGKDKVKRKRQAIVGRFLYWGKGGCAIQKLIYENLHGETAVFFHAPWVLGRVKGVGMSDVKVVAAEGAYQQGESITGLRREGRTVKVTLHLLAPSRQEMYRLRSELLGVLSPDKAFDGTRRARLLYENDFGRRWTWAVPESGLDWGERKQNAQPSLSLNFRCESPYWYGMTRQEAVFKAKKAGFTLPMKMPLGLGSKSFVCQVDSAGNAEAPAEIEITGAGEMPTLVNESTGEKICLVQPLPEGDTLVLDTDPARLKVRIRHGDGSEENGFGYLSPESSVAEFGLRPGENLLHYVPQGDGSRSVIRVRWYDCWEGV